MPEAEGYLGVINLLREALPMPSVEEENPLEVEDEDAIKDGAPCPCCVAELAGQDIGNKYRAEGVAIADGVTIHEHKIYVGSNHVPAALAVARTSGTQIYWDVGDGILIDASANFPQLPPSLSSLINVARAVSGVPFQRSSTSVPLDAPRETADERTIKNWYRSAPALAEWERWRRRKASGALPDKLAPSA